jgi:hypothetical protein
VQVIEVALEELLAPLNHRFAWVLGGKLLSTPEPPAAPDRLCTRVPTFHCQGHLVWGATAFILGELVELLETLDRPETEWPVAAGDRRILGPIQESEGPPSPNS